MTAQTNQINKQKTVNIRALAAKCCYNVIDKGRSLGDELPKQQDKVAAKDKGLLQEICYGVLRYLPELDRKIRAYIPWPVTQFTFVDANGKQHRIRVWQASTTKTANNETVGTIISVDKRGIVVATNTGAICLEVLQLPNKKALPVQDILNGRADWFKVGAHINGLIN